MYEDYIEYLNKKLHDSGYGGKDSSYNYDLFVKLSGADYTDNRRSKTKAGILDELLGVAEEVDEKSIGGAISSVFIYMGVAEEWLYDLLELARFEVDLKLFPLRIKHSLSERLQLNSLVSEIEKTIEFENKEDVVKYAGLVNQYRNKIAHDLFKYTSVEDITKEVSKFMCHFENLYEALEGTEENPYGARENLFDRIKQYNKWSDVFYDVYICILSEELDDLEIPYSKIEQFDKGEII